MHYIQSLETLSAQLVYERRNLVSYESAVPGRYPCAVNILSFQLDT
jgi:hypothetical protein